MDCFCIAKITGSVTLHIQITNGSTPSHVKNKVDRRQSINRKQWILERMGFLWYVLTSKPQLLCCIWLTGHCCVAAKAFWDFFKKKFFFLCFYVVVRVFLEVAYWPKFKKATTKCWYYSGPYMWLRALSQCFYTACYIVLQSLIL